jgi:uncharacterized damage-inducible protein DinB
MTEIDRLLDELRRAHEGDAWHGSAAREVLDGVTAEEARARPIADAHTIWEIALHIIAWRGEVARRVREGFAAMPAEGDWPAVTVTDDRVWRDVLARLDASHLDLLDAVARLPASKLDERVGTGRDAPLGSGVSYNVTLHGIVQHDAYHLGQISLIKKAARGASARTAAAGGQ